MTTEEKRIIFTGTPTTEEERKKLQSLGFVHVTGLHAYGAHSQPYIIGEKITEKDHGKWGHNNGVCSLVTTGGEVWIRTEFVSIAKKELEQLAPNGEGAFVPCSNGESPPLIDLLNRMKSPGFGIVVKS